MTAVLQALTGPGQGRLLTILRAPVGTREVVGADGVPYSERDDSGGPDQQKVEIDVRGLGEVTITDCRLGQVLPMQQGKIHVTVQAGDGHPLAVLPYQVTKLSSEAKVIQNDLTLTWTLHSTAKEMTAHVVHIDVRQAGKSLPHMQYNVTTGHDGTGRLLIPLAVEDGNALTVHIRDVLTGISGEAVIR
jgi:hypothetical protein